MDETVLPPFRVTADAIAAITDLGGAVRVDLEPGGCCGTFWSFSLVEHPPEDVERYGCPGAWLTSRPQHRTY